MNVRIYVWVGVLAMAFPLAATAGGSKCGMADYRWRSDDGGEGAGGASWKADAHTPIIGVKRDVNIRLRMAFASNGSITSTNTLKYATSTNGPWADVTTEVGRPFRITSTTWYADGDTTTAQIPIGGGRTFVSGRCVESPNSRLVVSLASSNEYTESEICLQATPYAARNTTYYFDCSFGVSAVWYPQLTIEDADVPPPVDIYVDDRDPNTARTGLTRDIASSGGSVVQTPSWQPCLNVSNAWFGGSQFCSTLGLETNPVSFRWIPNLPTSGLHNVYARWTYNQYQGRHVPYLIHHAGGTNEVFVDQRDPALDGQWNLLGTYTFNAGTNGWVELGGNDGQACADAVWLERVGGAPLDADGDGMLDTWENTYLGGTTASPTADADSDGMGNLSEYLAGTIPNDPSSVLAVVGLTGSGTTLDLKWLSVAGKTYGIQKSTNLMQGFPLTEAGGIDADAPTNTYSVPVGASGIGFYRVRLE